MPLPRLRSPFARAVVPVLGGVVVLGLIALFLWGMAAWISRGGAEATERIAPSELTVGPVESLAEEVAESGPLFFPELGTAIGTRSIVVDHTGAVAADGWRVYWAYPADREPTCVVEQVVGTRLFVDCDGREVDVSELSPPDEGVFPRVDGRETLVIDLRAAEAN
ncbi:MAG: hypothetical protein RIB65_21085 [Ilumatobacter fluminis]|uniref:hypothetical protein n=1 Tax=Ilumatobacter fluminis TaxID=467091 RepID=UPI00105BF681|nr:hypothetical protein [Ilumatobacter fluminis]